MRETVKLLLRLQELELIREEARIFHRRDQQDKMTHLDDTLRTLREQVPESWLRRFDGLRRSGIAVVHEFGGVCQNCRMSIALGGLNRMRKGDAEWICPNCGRFLLLSDEG
jgi:predicted  nucleic acid-binding Zn-ribbon protein